MEAPPDLDNGYKGGDNDQAVDEIIKKHFDQDESRKSPTKEEEEEDGQTKAVDKASALSDDDEDDGIEEIITPSQLLSRRVEVTKLKEEGNSSFRNGDYDEAIRKYGAAGQLCKHVDLHPERAILYSNRAASELRMGHAKPAVNSASKAIKYNPTYTKAYLRRAKAYEVDEKLDESLEDYKKVLELDPKSKEAQDTIPDLERRINERNEKMKTEMMDKLKDLGNLVLRPFGLSTSNFQMAQDPSTGGYSINFKQN